MQKKPIPPFIPVRPFERTPPQISDRTDRTPERNQGRNYEHIVSKNETQTHANRRIPHVPHQGHPSAVRPPRAEAGRATEGEAITSDISPDALRKIIGNQDRGHERE